LGQWQRGQGVNRVSDAGYRSRRGAWTSSYNAHQLEPAAMWETPERAMRAKLIILSGHQGEASVCNG
jgi:hypothetical protein